MNRLLLRVILTAAICFELLLPPFVATAQSGMATTVTFLGTWCVQGDPSRRASITANGMLGFNLTNESGSTSTGLLTGMGSRQISAPEWNLVQGSLSADGQTINWSNNTTWNRCRRPSYVDLQGTWYVGGDPTRACRIDQRRGNLKLRNDTGQRASGSFTDSLQIATTWAGNPIAGTISSDQNRIDWSNGTYWTR